MASPPNPLVPTTPATRDVVPLNATKSVDKITAPTPGPTRPALLAPEPPPLDGQDVDGSPLLLM